MNKKALYLQEHFITGVKLINIGVVFSAGLPNEERKSEDGFQNIIFKVPDAQTHFRL